jgi:SH3-like domain-containing protein
VQGDGGWIHASVLSPKRFIIIRDHTTKHEGVYMYTSAKLNSDIVANLHEDLRCKFHKCSDQMCKIECQDIKGWVLRDNLWGILESD